MHISRLSIALLLMLLLSGCAAEQAYKDGLHLLETGKSEEGLSQIETASKLDPDNSEYRSQYFRQRDILVYKWLSLAESAKAQGAWDEAGIYYRRIIKIDPENGRAKTGIIALRTEQRQAQLLEAARTEFDKGNLSEAGKIVRQVLIESPSNPSAVKLRKDIDTRKLLSNQTNSSLKSKLTHPITIEFKDAPIQAVFESISKVAGINVLFDKEVRPDTRVTLFVRDARIEDVIRFVLVTNQLEQRILNSNTLFVYPNTPQKLKDFQELQVRNFYLTNANAKDVAAMLKGLVKAKDIYVDEKLNLIVMRDRPDVIRVAERVIAAQDIAEPEVMLEVEVLEVGTSLLSTIGVQYPSQISASVKGAAGTAGSATLTEIINRNSSLVNVTMTDPALAINLLHQDGDTNLLANPKIRVKNHDKANIHIGDKVPVITNTTTATGLISQSITYLDVGLMLDVEPTVHLDNDVAIKVGLEVSNISKTIQNTDGSVTYQVGTRKASTSLRLKDGETQILAGLINKEDRRTSNSVPGLGQLPILGRLFSNNSDSLTKTEIVLLITPHVVRNVVRPDSPIEEFTSGTESSISLDHFEIDQADAAAASTDKAGRSMTDDGMEKPVALAANNTGTLLSAQDGAQTAGLLPLLGSVKLALDAPTQIKMGQEFTLSVNATAEGLQNALLDVSFDTAKFEIVRVEEGDLLKSQNGKTQFMHQIQDKAGRLNLSVVRQGNVQGKGALANVTFRALSNGAGSGVVRIGAANFSDAAGKTLPVDTLPVAAVQVTQ